MHRIGGIILAAGASTRMGEPKQLIELHGSALVCHAVRAAQDGGCDVVCVVTGHEREAVVAAVAPLHPMLAHNKDWHLGMGTSIRLGLSAIQPVSAVVLIACDQPLVDSTVIRALIDQHTQTGQPIVASYYAETWGIPALFDHTCFVELQNVPDERGAKAVIQANPARVASYDFPAGALDLDTPGDVEAWRLAEKMHQDASA